MFVEVGCIPAIGEGPPYDEWSLLLVCSETKIIAKTNTRQRQVNENVFERCGIVGRSRRHQGSDSAGGWKEY